MKNTVVTYGLIGGALIAGAMLIGMNVAAGKEDMSGSEIIGYISMIVALSTVFLGIRSYRNKELGGIITFGQGFKIGLLITLIASAIYVIVWMIYYEVGSGQEMMEVYFSEQIASLKQSGKSTSEIETMMAKMESQKAAYENPFVRIGITFLEIFPVGLIISLLSAFVLKRK